MKVWRNFAEILTLKGCWDKDGRKLEPADICPIPDSSVVFDDQKIIWVGADCDLPVEYQNMESRDWTGHVLTPELVDCHTHLIFGGDRAIEYCMRLNGADYQEIANAGGGILNTMNGTNGMNEEELFELARIRVERVSSYGVGSIEIKSGYGLTLDSERILSKVIHRLKKHFEPSIQIRNTFLAAHAVPKNFSSSKEYLTKVVLPLLKELAPLGIIDAVDIFHEKNYFDENNLRQLFDLATVLGIATKVHADEFNDNKGAVLAVEYGSISCDHLLCTTEDGVKALGKSDTVAVLLPGTGYFLGKKQANARGLLDAGARVAIASDFNPGSCHWDNLLQIASLAAPNYHLNISELWSAITLNPAAALRLENQGAIIKGLRPRFSVFKAGKYQEITYNWGRNLSVTFL